MFRTLTPAQARELLVQGDVEVVDVRDPHEWAGGHIAGARLLPLAQLRSGGKGALPHDGVVFICAAGVRSEAAARLAVSLGLRRVFHVSGGTRGWQKAGLPLVAPVSVAV